MKLNYDLHTHTTASDGSLRPSELVARARECSIDVLAVTDHDNTSGLIEAEQACEAQNIAFVPGIELSVSWSHQTLHIVGLHIDPQSPSLVQGIDKIREFRNWRAEEIARRLEKAGIEGALEGARKFAGSEILSRTHFGRFLVEEGYAKDMRQVFKRYLVHNKPGYVPGKWPDLEEGMNWIHEAGGIAVLAHPARYRLSSTRRKQLFTEFKNHGGIGIEVVSGSHSAEEIDHYSGLANHFGFFASRGSDYHGPENAYADPSRLPDLPEKCKPIWQSDRWCGKL